MGSDRAFDVDGAGPALRRAPARASGAGRRPIVLALMTPLLWLVCGCAAPEEERSEPFELRPDAPPIGAYTECVVTLRREPVTTDAHVTTCEPLEYPSHPPTGGLHYTTWAAYETYDRPVPWPFLVHSLEHGAVVLAYNCPEGCPEVLAFLERLRAERNDPGCRRYGIRNRLIIVPDPDLDVPLAAVAWEHLYLATCLDEPSLRAFVDARYGQGPENTCDPGVARDSWCP